jgi:CRP/FNR family transcriptional regulator, cyclic AMP receptor protein
MQDDAKLRCATVFREIPPGDLMPILVQSKTRDYDDGDVIFMRGDAGEQAYIVIDGLVQISSLSESGKRVTVEIFKEQDVFGELAVIDRGTRTADAIALGFAKVAAIPAEAFRDLLYRSPAFSVNLLRLVATRLRRTYTLFEDASLTDLEHRLARQVLYLVKLGATGSQRVRLYSRLHQSDLADLLGATPRSIISILNKWRLESLVNFDGRTAQLTILDLERFRILAEGVKAGQVIESSIR